MLMLLLLVGLDEAKGLGLDRGEQLRAEDAARRVQGNIETGDAAKEGGEKRLKLKVKTLKSSMIKTRHLRIGRHKVHVIPGANGNAGHRLEALLAGGQRRTSGPKVHQVLLLLVGHSLQHPPEPAAKVAEVLGAVARF